MSDHRPSRPRPAWRSPQAWAVLLAATAVLLAADLITKHLAFERIAPTPVELDRALVMSADRPGELLPRHEPVVVVPHVLELTLVLNEGAVFGIGAGKRWFFVAFTFLALGFVLWIFARSTHARERVAHLGAAMLIAGGLGNMYDRLRFACVRDFLHPLPTAKIGDWVVWPYVSNIADLWVLIGIVILLIHAWRPAPSTLTPQTKETPSSSADDG
ncbi:MAG: signal peptidase II [Planctomycetota bacterium]